MVKKHLLRDIIFNVDTGRTPGKAVEEALGELQKSINGLIMEYAPEDIPVIAAAFKVAATAIEARLDSYDKRLYKHLSENLGVETVKIDLDELKRQTYGTS